MKKKLLTLSILLTSFQTAYAETQRNTALDTVEQKASYTLGADLAKNFIQQGIEIDSDALIMGFEDALKKRPLKLNQQEMNSAIQALKQKIMAKRLADFKAKADENHKKGQAFLAENQKKPGVHTTDSGLQYKILQKSKNTDNSHPTEDSTVIAHYEGRLIDGKIFDSSYQRGTPLKFELSNVIPGWQEALKMMKPGDIWEVYIPAKLAYGEKGAGNTIGPNETLIFKVELISVEPDTEEAQQK